MSRPLNADDVPVWSRRDHAEALAAAEARGWQQAVEALRAASERIGLIGSQQDGLAYAADFLESMSREDSDER